MDGWIVVIIVSQLAFIAFLVAVAVNHRQKTLERRSEERLRVLERFGSGQELADFLATERGSQLLQMFAVKAGNPARIIITGVAISVLALFVGVAFLAVEYRVAGMIVLFAAIGILAASIVSLRLARKFGLLPSDVEPNSAPRQ